jgi:hypothetical protein
MIKILQTLSKMLTARFGSLFFFVAKKELHTRLKRTQAENKQLAMALEAIRHRANELYREGEALRAMQVGATRNIRIGTFVVETSIAQVVTGRHNSGEYCPVVEFWSPLQGEENVVVSEYDFVEYLEAALAQGKTLKEGVLHSIN